MHCWGRGVYLPGGVYLQEGTCPGGVPARGCTCPGGYSCPGGVPTWGCTCLGGVLAQGGVPAQGGTCPGTPLVSRTTDRCKNITLPQTSFAGGNKLLLRTPVDACVDYTYPHVVRELSTRKLIIFHNWKGLDNKDSSWHFILHEKPHRKMCWQ